MYFSPPCPWTGKAESPIRASVSGRGVISNSSISSPVKDFALATGVFDSLTFVVTKGWRWSCLPPSPLDSGVQRNDEGMPRMTNERLLERSIQDRSPGHAFIAIAHPAWRRHTKV